MSVTQRTTVEGNEVLGDQRTLSRQNRDTERHFAEDNRARLEAAGILGVNLMAAPGAGKTSLIQRTIEAFSTGFHIGVVEAIAYSDSPRPEPIYGSEIPLAHVDTGGAPHLDAVMLSHALRRLPLEEIDLLLVENVGNLIQQRPSRLGLQANVVISSVPEGHDNPYRYSAIYRDADVVVLNKTDLLGWVSFDLQTFRQGVELLNPGVPVLPLSCYTGADLYRWIDWLAFRRKIAPAAMAAKGGR